MSRQRKQIPKVVLVMRPVDGGRAVIGLIECPNCGQDHYTTQINCGVRSIFCGLDKVGKERPNIAPDGYSKVDVVQIV